MINWSTEIIRFINLTRSDRRASEKYGTDVDNTWTKEPWLTIHEREKEIKKGRKEGRKDLLVPSEVKLGRKVGEVGGQSVGTGGS